MCRQCWILKAEMFLFFPHLLFCIIAGMASSHFAPVARGSLFWVYLLFFFFFSGGWLVRPQKQKLQFPFPQCKKHTILLFISVLFMSAYSLRWVRHFLLSHVFTQIFLTEKINKNSKFDGLELLEFITFCWTTESFLFLRAYCLNQSLPGIWFSALRKNYNRWQPQAPTVSPMHLLKLTFPRVSLQQSVAVSLLNIVHWLFVLLV